MFITLAATTTCHGQSVPSIKGHTLGETVQQFVSESNDITKSQIMKCESSGGKDRYGAPWFECDDFLTTLKVNPSTARAGTGSFSCENPIYQLSLCGDFRGKVTFQANKLVELNLEIADKEWNGAVKDVVARFGKPDERHIDREENVYGVKLDLQTATWVKPDYMVVLSEKVIVPYEMNKVVDVNLINRNYYENTHARQDEDTRSEQSAGNELN